MTSKKLHVLASTGPSLDDFQRYAEGLTVAFDPSIVKGCWRYYSRRGWRFHNGETIKPDHWLTILEAWERDFESRAVR